MRSDLKITSPFIVKFCISNLNLWYNQLKSDWRIFRVYLPVSFLILTVLFLLNILSKQLIAKYVTKHNYWCIVLLERMRNCYFNLFQWEKAKTTVFDKNILRSIFILNNYLSWKQYYLSWPNNYINIL